MRRPRTSAPRPRRAALAGAPLALALGLLLATATWAQTLPGLGSAPEHAEDPIRAEAVASRRAAVARELAALENAAPTDAPALSQQREVRERLREIADSLDEEQRILDLAAAPRASELPPADAVPSLVALRELYERRSRVEREQQRQLALLDAGRQALDAAKAELAEAERRRREAKERLDAAPGAEAERALALRGLESRAAQERVHLQTLRIHQAEAARDAPDDAAGLQGRIDRMRDELARGEGDASVAALALTGREGDLRRGREAIERRLASSELLLEAAQKRFAREPDPAPALLEEVEALTAGRDALRNEMSLVDAQLERVTAQRDIYRFWDEALRESTPEAELPARRAELARGIEELRSAELRRRGRVADLEERVAAVQRRIGEVPAGSRLRTALEGERAALGDLLEAQRAEVDALAADRRLSERVLADLDAGGLSLDPMEALLRVARTVRDAWRYEITSVDDAPITIGSLTVALLLAAVGFAAARRGSALVERIARRRFQLHDGAANAFQTLSFYALLVSFTLLALRAVHFPLTAFTVLGGALAIGVGFGSQNVMNNFISGLILMLERPVRVRDVVEIEGQHGVIETIGARSTQIRSTDGRHIIVPNSFFLESNVVNWTLSDDLIRAKVGVGVIYGSPTRLVEELILRVMQEDEQILKQPAPILIFEEFGDNSLNFDVYFWVRARSPMEVKKVQSRVRFRIDDLFREHELVIAFPQRDVHLDTVAPVEVRILGEGGKES